MPKLVSHVIGLIEIDAPANPIDAMEPPVAESEAPEARILRFDTGERGAAAPRILRLHRAQTERRQGDLARLCQELELELIRVRRLMASLQRMSRD